MNKSLTLVLFSLLFCSCSTPQTEKSIIGEIILMDSPTNINSQLPYLTKGIDNQLYLSWIETIEDDSMLFKYSQLRKNPKLSGYKGYNWTIPEIISSGKDWFVNWADYPMISVNTQGGILAHYLQKSAEGSYTYDIQTVQKIKGKSWQSPIKPHTDNTVSEHGFVSMLPLDSGHFFLSWLDGRNTVSDSKKSSHNHDEHVRGAMTIRTAVIDNQGVLSKEAEIDNRVCDCCQTSTAMTDNGPVVVYRDRSNEEVRDMSIVRYVDNHWTMPQTIYADNWKIDGCPVNGPRTASKSNNLSIAWFSAARDTAEVKIIFSQDAGATFGEPITVDDTNPYGRVDLLMIDKHTALVSWLDENDENALIKAAKFNQNGIIGEEFVIAKTSSSRSSGFPQMEMVDDKVYFAWTDLGTTQVKIASITL